MERVICLVLGYVFGLFQTSYIYGKFKHVDIREYGSGNAGTTNAMRTLGRKAGVITYIGDCLKAIICSFLVCFIFKDRVDQGMLVVLRMYAGVGVMLGHIFPFYMGFKGGKGIAAASGVVISLFDFKIIVIELLLFIAVVKISRYVSLGSLTITLAFLIEMIVFNELHILGFFNNTYVPAPEKYELYLVILFIVAIAWYKHKANIKRLLNGTESKIKDKKSKNAKTE